MHLMMVLSLSLTVNIYVYHLCDIIMHIGVNILKEIRFSVMMLLANWPKI